MSGSSNFLSDIGKKYIIGGKQFIIEKEIAEGGYGVVFLVRDVHTKRFALKRLYVNDDCRLTDCKLEIEILNLLSAFPNVIKYVDSSITRLNNGVYEVLILTNFYPGTCVHLQEERGVFTEKEVLQIFCDMCEAISVLHHSQQPITHRDIKLENILMDRNHSSVLCDFGSATRHSYVKGQRSKSVRELEDDFHKHTTPSHRAPEIVDLYSNQSITTKIDIWALGISLYRLCFNALPFGESSLAIQSGHFSIPEKSKYSEALHALIYYCLEVDSEHRPDIYQVSSIGFRLLGSQSRVNSNINKVPEPSISQIIDARTKRQQQHRINRCPSPRTVADRSEWVETTTVIPRERPKPGKHLKPPTGTSNPSQQQQSSSLRQNPVPTHQLLDMSTHQPQSMAGSLDSTSSNKTFVSSSNPFGDDFSRYSLNTRPSHIAPTTHASSVHQTGFEDSFADLLKPNPATSTTSQNQAGGNLLLNHHLTVADPVRGHRRYKSDTTSLMNSRSRQTFFNSPNSGIPLNTSEPVTHSASASPFEDDFSSFTSSQLSNQMKNLSVHSSEAVSTSRTQPLDEFGSKPFNPSHGGKSATRHSSWKYPNGHDIVPGFS